MGKCCFCAGGGRCVSDLRVGREKNVNCSAFITASVSGLESRAEKREEERSLALCLKGRERSGGGR